VALDEKRANALTRVACRVTLISRLRFAARVPPRGLSEACSPDPLDCSRNLLFRVTGSPAIACRRLLCQPREAEKSAPANRGNLANFRPPLLFLIYFCGEFYFIDCEKFEMKMTRYYLIKWLKLHLYLFSE